MTSRSAIPRNDESDTVQAAAKTKNKTQDLWHFLIIIAGCCDNPVNDMVMILTIGIIATFIYLLMSSPVKKLSRFLFLSVNSG